VWQADRELSGTATVGGLEREWATTGAYHQTGEFDAALLDGGSVPGHSSQPSGMAQQVFPLNDAPGPEDRRVLRLGSAAKVPPSTGAGFGSPAPLRQLLARDSAPLVGIGLDETAIDRQVVPVHQSDSRLHATIS